MLLDGGGGGGAPEVGDAGALMVDILGPVLLVGGAKSIRSGSPGRSGKADGAIDVIGVFEVSNCTSAAIDGRLRFVGKLKD